MAQAARWGVLARLGGGVAWALMLVGIPLYLVGLGANHMIDLQAYRTGGLAWLDGLPLYGDSYPYLLSGPRLPFTYPPIAAVLFGALAVIPLWLAQLLVTMGSFVALTGALLVVGAKLNIDVWLTLVAVAMAYFLEPAKSTLSFGQVNILLMALVVADCLTVRNRWLRGAMTGLAAAIKLTPAVFVLFFLVRRDWRAAVTTVVSFVLTGLLGLILAPQDTAQYWFHSLLEPSRAGGLAFATNQSLRGVLHRFDLPGDVESALWALLVAAVVAVALVGARRAVRAGDDVAALLIVAVTGLLVSPVSWSHHWVWVVPITVMLASRLLRARAWRHLPWLSLWVLVFWVNAFRWLPQTNDLEMRWTLVQHAVGDSYVLLGVGFLLVMAFGWRYEVRPMPTIPAEVAGSDHVADGHREVAQTGDLR